MSVLGQVLGVDGIGAAATELEKVVGGVLQKVIPDADERLKAQTEIQRAAEESVTARMQAMQAVMTEDSKSDSKYTKNARPTVVYWSLAMITLVSLLGLVGLADPVIAALGQVPAGLWNLVTYGIGAFTVGRTAEKVVSPLAGAVASAIRSRAAK